MLAAWLRNERRLGIRHYDVPPTNVARPEPAAASETARQRAPATAQTPVMLPLSVDEPGLPPLCTRELSPEQAQRELDALRESHVKDCTRCGLHKNRRQTVFGQGAARPALVFVGEGPGAEEDIQGLAFVGRAGQLLTRMIAAMTLTRDEVYICNIVKCRPPGNRTPAEDEVRTCSPYLFRQLAILRPKVIVALGRPAAQTLLATKAPIGKLRGQFHDFPPPELGRPELPPVKLMPTFHPAYLLRSPGEKAKAWSDLKQVMSYLGIAIPPRL